MEEEIQKINVSQPVEAPSTDGTGGSGTTHSEPTSFETNEPPKKRSFKKPLGILGVVLAVLAVIGVAAFFFIVVPLTKTYADAQKAIASARSINEAFKAQDIQKVNESVVATQNQVKVVQQDLSAVGWAKFVPFLGAYISDAEHGAKAAYHGLEGAKIMTLAVEPYADILGLKGQGTFAGGTAEDRIAKLVETFDKVTPQVDQVAKEMEIVKSEMAQIDPNRYPEEFQGRPVRAQIIEAKNLATAADELLTEARPLVKQIPTLLGSKGEAKYLVLFQNDKELRPTGGFITAYAVFRVDKGKIALDAADDIYKLDDTIKKNVTPPEPISKYLNVYGWRLRDSNFSPDFAESMKVFEDIYASSSQKKQINGIIAVDTHLLVALMEALGPVDAYGMKFTTDIVPECNCPMVVYELEKQAGTPRGYWVDNRKDMIGVLLQALMKKALQSGRQTYTVLSQTVIQQALEKHLLVYLHDPEAQKGIEALNFAGRIKTGNDYLHINDANLGGAKSNLYVVQSVKDTVTITDSGADVDLEISYKYPKAADNCSLERKEGLCLAGIYRDYMRVYLPAGATIKEVKGFENKSTTFEDLGHTVIDGFFTVVPNGLGKITVKYSVKGDFKKNGEYKVLIQKQPGTAGNEYTLTVNGQEQKFALTEDKEVVVKL